MTMADLAKLKAEHIAAREAFEMLGMANCEGLSLDDQIKLDIAYRRAQRRYHDAYYAYSRAIEEAI